MVWIFLPADRIAGGEVRIDGPKGHHLARVLRVRPGDEGVAVCERIEHTFTVVRVEGDLVLGTIRKTAPNRTEPAIRVTLLQALLPNPDFDAVLENATALGISRFIPLRTSRVVVRPDPARTRRWRAIAESAAEQSHRGLVPEILPVHSLGEALAVLGDERLLVLHPGVGTALTQAAAADGPFALAVGPEGGWTPEELELLRGAGGHPVGLGPRVLRARLAGIAAAAILVNHADARRRDV